MNTERVLTDAKPKADVRDWRIEQYEDMQFTKVEAEKLADAKDSAGVDTNYRVVLKALEQGCGHKQALRIFT